MKALVRFAAATLVLGLVTQPAAAQFVSNPTYFGPKPETGLTIAADYGKGLNNASGKGQNIGGRAQLSLPMIMVGIGAGSFKAVSGGTSATQFEGEAALTLMSLPLTGVSVGLHAAGGYWSNSGVKQMTVPIGITLGVKPPTPGMSIEPWVSPRIQYTRLDLGAALGTTSTTKAGVSAGVNLGMPGGLGLHAAIDYLNVSGGSPMTFGVGVHYSFTVPGLGAVPGM